MYAVAESFAEPLATDVVFNEIVKGAVDDEPILVKPYVKSTRETQTLSVALTVIGTVPATVAPEAGETSVTDGGVVSPAGGGNPTMPHCSP